MRAALSLCRAGFVGSMAIVLSTAVISRADDPPAADGAVRLQRRIVVNRDQIDDVGALGKYWLDMRLTTVPKPLDEQLQLGGKGALVTAVGEDGPSAKAGLKAHDVVLAVGERGIEKLSDLVDEVNKSEGQEVSLKILRAGKEMTLAVKPAERFKAQNEEQEETEDVLKYRIGDVDVDIRKLEEKIREKLKDAGVDLRLQLIEPGRFVPRVDLLKDIKAPEFPDDLSIAVTKTGKSPAQIEVKQGDKSWSVTDDKLDELPEEVRGHVKTFLGRAPMRFAIATPGGKFNVPLPPGLIEGGGGDLPETSERSRLDKRFDEMQREMNRMRERMEDLRRQMHEDLERAKKRRQEAKGQI